MGITDVRIYCWRKNKGVTKEKIDVQTSSKLKGKDEHDAIESKVRSKMKQRKAHKRDERNYIIKI